MTCPRCGAESLSGGKCLACGAIRPVSAKQLLPRKVLDSGTIFAACEQLYGVPLSDLQQKSRRPKIIPYRHAVMVCLYEYAHLSTSAIGALLRRDHSTVVYAINKWDQKKVTHMVRDLAERATFIATYSAAPPP